MNIQIIFENEAYVKYIEGVTKKNYFEKAEKLANKDTRCIFNIFQIDKNYDVIKTLF